MSVREEFDIWAAEGRDRGMEERHWHTARHVLASMPVEADDVVLDLGTGSGYALRALQETRDSGRGYGLDGSLEMCRNARRYTDDGNISFVHGDFETLPFETNSLDHVFTMEAFYYATHPRHTLSEINRALRPGGTLFCAVNYFEESIHTHDWQESISIEMTLWDRQTYRSAFRDAGLAVGAQLTVPDRDIEIPPASTFPTVEWDTREEMIDRYRTWGTLLTVGVATAVR